MRILIFNWNNVLTDVIAELKLRGHEVITEVGVKKKDDWKKFDIIVVWQETEDSGLRRLIPIMQKAGKKVVLVQHGRRGSSRVFAPFNETILSDAVCLWGENDRKRNLEAGAPADKLKVTGSAVIQYIKRVQRIPHKGKNVLFIPEHWGVEVIENNLVAGQLRKLKGVEVMTKLLEGEHATYYQNPVFSDRAKGNHLEVLAKCLSIADVVVGISESTAELMAEVMDIPVVIAKIWQFKPGANGDERYLTYRREYSNACDTVENIFELNDRIKYALKHPEHLRYERSLIAQTDGGADINDPREEIIRVILDK